MIVYEVYDGDEVEVAYPTKREAIERAREVPHATVTRVSIPSPVTREIACRLINGEGYAIEQIKIYENRGDLTRAA